MPGVIEVPSRVGGKRMYLARVSDFVSWDEACVLPIHVMFISLYDKSLKVFNQFRLNP